jgi:hypothetical protein
MAFGRIGRWCRALVHLHKVDCAGCEVGNGKSNGNHWHGGPDKFAVPRLVECAQPE